MIGNKLEQLIIGVFQDSLDRTFSINEVSKELKKSYPIINKKSNFFLKEGVLRKINMGRSYQCFLNFDNDKTKIFLAMNELNRREMLIHKTKNFEYVLEEISKLTRKYKIETIVLCKDKMIIVSEQEDKKKEIMESTILAKEFDVVVLDRKNFQEYFMKEVSLQKNRVVMYNASAYVNIMGEIGSRLLMRDIIKNSTERYG